MNECSAFVILERCRAACANSRSPTNSALRPLKTQIKRFQRFRMHFFLNFGRQTDSVIYSRCLFVFFDIRLELFLFKDVNQLSIPATGKLIAFHRFRSCSLLPFPAFRHRTSVLVSVRIANCPRCLPVASLPMQSAQFAVATGV